jgi:CheY-like chemotaxis protein
VANNMNDVIVADDDPLIISVLSEIFNRSGYIVRTASDGFAALASIRERVHHILISDLNMPRMSGFELLSIVRRRFPSIAVIAMSGAYSDEAVPQGVAADAFYPKGSSSVDRFVEILFAIKDQATRCSLHAAAPIWIPGLPINQDGLTTIAVACPECLRTFPHCLRYDQLVHTEHSCPHCHHLVQLAIVRTTADRNEMEPGRQLRQCESVYLHTYVEVPRPPLGARPNAHLSKGDRQAVSSCWLRARRCVQASVAVSSLF